VLHELAQDGAGAEPPPHPSGTVYTCGTMLVMGTELWTGTVTGTVVEL